MQDIGIICRLLRKKGHDEIADLLQYGKYDINQYGGFGSYHYSVLSTFRIFLPEEKYFEAMEFSVEVKNIILEAVLVVYPHRPEDVEITGIEFCLDQNDFYSSGEDDKPILKNNHHHFINDERIAELKNLPSSQFDCKKLVRYCEEAKLAFENEMYFATAMLTRAILDHIPPIFGKQKFTEVANNCGQKSFKENMDHLEKSSRKIADACLHSQIREKEALPTKTQVDCSSDLDVLLQEICRILK